MAKFKRTAFRYGMAALACMAVLAWLGVVLGGRRPQVVAWRPGARDDAALDSVIELSFDRRMDTASVRAAFHITPAVPGQLSFVTLEPPPVFRSPLAGFSRLAAPSGGVQWARFTPQPGLAKATRYQVSLDSSARSAGGQSLGRPFTAVFTTAGELHVTFTPPSGASDVPLNTTLRLSFDAPFSATTPIALSFSPPVAGRGQWWRWNVQARSYEFQPLGLRPATRYSVSLPAGLTAPGGERLLQDAHMTFTTTLPGVLSCAPRGQFASPATLITLTFNAPLDKTAAEGCFSLQDAEGQIVSGQFRWLGPDQMVFAPDTPLHEGETYAVGLASGLRSTLSDLTSQRAWQHTFRVAPRPAWLASSPRDGDTQARPAGLVRLHFNVPMHAASVENALHVSSVSCEGIAAPGKDASALNKGASPAGQNPAVSDGSAPSACLGASVLDKSALRFKWRETAMTLEISVPMQPSTLYTFMLDDGALDALGRTLPPPRSLVFRTAQLDPLVWLIGPRDDWNQVYGVYNPNPHVRQYVQFRNVEKLTYSLSSLSRPQFLATFSPKQSDPPAGALLFTWTQTVTSPLNTWNYISTHVARPNGSPLPPGAYKLALEAEPGDKRDWRMLIVSPLSLVLKRSDRQALVWATDMRTGQPAAYMPISVYDQAMLRVVQGYTDADGVFVSDQAPPCGDRWECAYGWRPLYAAAEGQADQWGFVASTWNHGIAARDFRMPYYYGEPSHTLFMYSDRPIYRPGQTVYFKGVVRQDDDGRYALPALGSVSVVINDAQGNEIYRQDLPLTDMGTFSGQVQLGDEAALGSYKILARYANDESPAQAEWRVAEYRKPEFKVSVTPATLTPLDGEAMSVTVQADYYFGAPLVGADVKWRLRSRDYRLAWAGEWYSFDEASEAAWLRNDQAESYGYLYADGAGQTDAQGRLVVALRLDLSRQARSQVLTFEADVTDQNQQVTSARAYLVAHKAGLYLGLRPRWYVAQAQQPLEIQALALSPDQSRLAGQAVTLELYRREWRSVRVRHELYGVYAWQSHYSDTLLYTQTLVTAANGQAQAVVTPPGGGQYRVVARGQDARGAPVSSAVFFWAYGAPGDDDYINWGVQNDDRLTLIPDKQSYRPGETARLLATAPFSGGLALVSLERGGVLRYWTQPVQATSALIEVPIQAEDAPNVFVSVVLFKGQSPDFPVADFKMGYAALNVELTQQRLKVELTPDRVQVAPGDLVTYTLRVSDAAGRPVEAELSLSLVDAAVLALVGDDDRDILTAFYRQRGLGVHTSASLIASVDRFNAYLDKKEKGGSGGAPIDTRELFADTAFWRAALRTGVDGQAQAVVRLPDNLTTWRMRAKAVTADTRLGQAQVDVVATQDIVLRPVLPRFLSVGDNARLGAVVHNFTPVTASLSVSLQVSALSPDSLVFNARPQPLTLGPGASASVYWPITVPRTVSMTFDLRAVTPRGRGDALHLSLPVEAFFETRVYSNYQPVSDTALITLPLPGDVKRDVDELLIEVEPSLAASIDNGLDYLITFPYGCVEQTMSSFLPDVLVMRLIKQTGLGARPGLRERLGEMIESGMQRLYGYQHNDGGWGWWKNDDSNPAITAYVLYGLHQMEQGGRTVDARRRDQAAGYLLDWLRRSALDDPIGPLHGAEKVASGANVRAYALYVLAELGQGDAALAGRLYEQRDKLDHYGRAYLALALSLTNARQAGRPASLNDSGQADARVETLLQEVRAAARQEADLTYWQDKQYDAWGMSSGVRTSAIALEALARLFAADPLVDPAARWLLMQRQEGHWSTTQETSLSLSALVEYISATLSSPTGYTYTLHVNGQPIAAQSVTSQTIGQRGKWVVPLAGLADGDPTVEIRCHHCAGHPLRATVSLRHYRSGDGIEAIDNQGFHVRREYTRPDGGALGTVRLGDVISVSVTVELSASHAYVIVEDRLPAGLEVIDASLATTSRSLYRPAQQGWVWSHVELRDERVALFAAWLPAGQHTYTYLARATTAGSFYLLPAQAYAMYKPDVAGRTAGGKLNVFTFDRH